HLTDFRGKTVMLNFWATWCDPCRAEMPAMEMLHNRFKDKGLVILAVAVGEERGPVQAFVEEYRLTFPVELDTHDQVTDDYRIWSVPTTYFINSRGEIISLVQGSRSWDRKDAIQYISHLLNT
ncbi:MAG: redoxin domain-containing protein, partial [Nitrospirae bacterium]|nr:redoxin domain-containing protein [Nitrospirota bacterium]